MSKFYLFSANFTTCVLRINMRCDVGKKCSVSACYVTPVHGGNHPLISNRNLFLSARLLSRCHTHTCFPLPKTCSSVGQLYTHIPLEYSSGQVNGHLAIRQISFGDSAIKFEFWRCGIRKVNYAKTSTLFWVPNEVIRESFWIVKMHAFTVVEQKRLAFSPSRTKETVRASLFW